MNRIKELRLARKWSLAELARRVEPPTTAPQIQKLERGDRRLTDKWIDRLAGAFGCAPAELLARRGANGHKNAIRSPDVKKLESILRSGAAKHRSTGESDDDGMIVIPQLDVRATSGDGGLSEVDEVNERSVIIGHFGFPEQGFRQTVGAPAANTRVIEVIGDSMAPTLFPGQKVLIDLSDTRPSPPGIFVVWDGLGLVLKRVTVLPHSEPLTVRITSDNREYEPYERTLEEAHIQARVIGFWGRL